MAKPLQVSWHVLLDDESWDDSGEARAVYAEHPPVASRSHPTRKRALQSVGLLFVLLLLFGYAFWESAQALQHPVGPTVNQPPPISADMLAANARRILLTEHLRFDASGGDIAIVAATLAEMEALYLETFAAVGLSPTHGEDAPDGRLLVVVRGTGAPVWKHASGRVTLPSPTALPAAGTNSQELLRQAWRLALVDEVSRDAKEAYNIPPGWLPLLGGLRLWLLRDGGGPLGQGWDGVTNHLYGVEGHHLSPTESGRICDEYAAWDIAPIDFSIPLGCRSDRGDGAYIVPVPLTLATLGLPETFESRFVEEVRPAVSTARRVALALFLEYAVERYRAESLPALFGALAGNGEWESLIPAVYGVTPSRLEAEWQAWMLGR